MVYFQKCQMLGVPNYKREKSQRYVRQSEFITCVHWNSRTFLKHVSCV